MEGTATPAKHKGWRRLSPKLLPARGVLGVLSFFGFFTNYMLRVNLNIGIVAMSRSPSTVGNSTIITSHCVPDRSNITTLLLSPDTEEEAEFSWSTHQQALILGSFYWSYVVSLVPGGRLAELFGTKRVFGGANLVHAIMGLATPLAARTHFSALLAVRLVQGFVSGMTWPAMHVMASRWIPPHERSKFVTTYLGNAVGTAVTYPLCGLLIDSLGWESAFYVPALITLGWCVAWWCLVFDTPAQHPRIHPAEREYLEKTVVSSKEQRKSKVPWSEVACSLPFWALLVANIGSIWAFMTIITYGPTYLKMVHGFGIRANGLLSGLPNLSRFCFAVMFSWLVDSLLAAGKLTVTRARKLATGLSEVLPALLFLLMGRFGCNASAEIAVLTIASGINGFASSGPLVNSVDLAPNFSGTLLGLVSVVSMCSGFLVPLLVSAIISQDQSIERWQLVFVSAAAINVASAAFYMFFGSGETQPWNVPKKKVSSTQKEEDHDHEGALPLKPAP